MGPLVICTGGPFFKDWPGYSSIEVIEHATLGCRASLLNSVPGLLALLLPPCKV